MSIYERDGDIVIIRKHKDYLTSYERLLLKTQPEKYVLKEPKKKKGKKHKAYKLSKQEREEKKLQKLWKEVDKMLENPKKYNKKKKKRDKILERYSKEHGKHTKKSKKQQFITTNAVAYLDHVIADKEKERMGLRGNLFVNSSFMFMNSFGKKIDTGDNKKMALLKELENEVLSRLHEDAFESDRLIVEYYDGDKKKLKKKFKDKDDKKSKKKKKKKHKHLEEVIVDKHYVNSLLHR